MAFYINSTGEVRFDSTNKYSWAELEEKGISGLFSKLSSSDDYRKNKIYWEQVQVRGGKYPAYQWQLNDAGWKYLYDNYTGIVTSGDVIRALNDEGTSIFDTDAKERVLTIFPSISNEIISQDKVLEYEKNNNLTSVNVLSYDTAKVGDTPVYIQQNLAKAKMLPLLIGGAILLLMMSK